MGVSSNVSIELFDLACPPHRRRVDEAHVGGAAMNNYEPREKHERELPQIDIDRHGLAWATNKESLSVHSASRQGGDS